jgi:hypothetical protein
LNSDFRQLNCTPKPVPFGPDSYCKSRVASQGVCAKIWRPQTLWRCLTPARQNITFNDI